jgi:carbon monoxide dehydrogenase subunit G
MEMNDGDDDEWRGHLASCQGCGLGQAERCRSAEGLHSRLRQLTKDDDTHFSAVVKVKLGPVKATFRGKVELVDLDPPNGYRIQGEGEGGIAGFAKGGAKVVLSEAEGGQTLLRYDVEAQVGGKLMQLGARLIDSVSKKLADEFFANFAKAVSEG